jgi:hypothetical protein
MPSDLLHVYAVGRANVPEDENDVALVVAHDDAEASNLYAADRGIMYEEVGDVWPVRWDERSGAPAPTMPTEPSVWILPRDAARGYGLHDIDDRECDGCRGWFPCGDLDEDDLCTDCRADDALRVFRDMASLRAAANAAVMGQWALAPRLTRERVLRILNEMVEEPEARTTVLEQDAGRIAEHDAEQRATITGLEAERTILLGSARLDIIKSAQAARLFYGDKARVEAAAAAAEQYKGITGVRESYVPQDVAADMLRMLDAAGFGKLGDPRGNTLHGMVAAAVAELAEARATLAADQGLPGGALPGWHPGAHGAGIGLISWIRADEPFIIVKHSTTGDGWFWIVEGPSEDASATQTGFAPTARDAMRKADTARGAGFNEQEPHQPSTMPDADVAVVSLYRCFRCGEPVEYARRNDPLPLCPRCIASLTRVPGAP